MRALADYRKNSGDFADYVIGHISRRSGCTAVYTFDNKLKRSSLFHAVKSRKAFVIRNILKMPCT